MAPSKSGETEQPKAGKRKAAETKPAANGKVEKAAKPTESNSKPTAADFKRGKELFDDPDTYDVVFVFNSGERLRAHKAILALYSDVFHRMMYGPLSNNEAIAIPDVEAHVFRLFMRYFYFGEILLNADNVAVMLYIAEKYNVQECVENCAEFLSRVLDAENVLTVLRLGLMYNRDDIVAQCEPWIYTYRERTFTSPEFMTSPQFVLDCILSMKVHSCSEADLFIVSMSWIQDKIGAAAATKETVEVTVGELLWKKICYGSITPAEMCDLRTRFPHVITAAALNEIANSVLNGANDDNSKFNGGTRDRAWAENTSIHFDRTLFSWSIDLRVFEQPQMEVRFTTLRPCILRSITFAEVHAGTIHDPEDCTLFVPMTIHENQTNNAAADENIMFDDLIRLNSNGLEVEFERPLFLRCQHVYTVRLSELPRNLMYIGRMLSFCDGIIVFGMGSSSIVTGVKINVIT